ncbi:MAG: hypothetical protein WB992_22140 [Bryobacteraceae bacterium]
MRATLPVFAVLLLACGSKPSKHTPAPTQKVATAKDPANSLTTPTSASASQGYTELIAHNVILRENSSLKISVKWLRGRMYRTRPDVVPSLDKLDSFYVEVENGRLESNLADVSALLNSGALKGSPLTNVRLAPQGRQIKLNGTLHRGVPIPIQLIGDIAPASDGARVQVHVAKLDVLHIPVKGLLGALKIKTAELFDPKGAKGIQVSGDDVFFDANQILPPPHNRGKLTDIHVDEKGNLVEVFGSARPDVIRVKEWRNFMRLRGGAVEFGKLTMQNADIFIIDTSPDNWFEFDIAHYEEQLVNGYTRITPQAGLQIFMPDIGKIPTTTANQKISLEWMKNRNLPPPADVTP